jgi:hypothetical protein
MGDGNEEHAVLARKKYVQFVFLNALNCGDAVSGVTFAIPDGRSVRIEN